MGKSTTAVNFTAYLGYYGFKTLVVDIDPQSNSTSGLGISLTQDMPSIYNVIISGVDAEMFVKASFPNLYVMPSSIQLAGAEVELV